MFLLRRFAQLALLHGGHRVYAGLGAGWSPREFEALGLSMPPLAARIARLEEALRLARALFERGVASQQGEYVTALDLPLAPAPAEPPRLLVGGGSPAVLELAARYADHVDLAPPHRRGTMLQRPLLTATAELEEASGLVRSGERRPTTSILLSAVELCERSAVVSVEEAVCARVGLSPRSLADCPYALIGEPGSVAERIHELRERLGLDWIIVPERAVDRFSSEVLPLLP